MSLLNILKKCCVCGKKLNPTHIAMNLKLSGRNMKEDKMMCKEHLCNDCGYENDRDYNAAMNIRDCGTRLLAW